MPKVSVARDSSAVILSLGPEKGPGDRATLTITHRGLLALTSNLEAAARAEDEFDAEFILTGELICSKGPT